MAPASPPLALVYLPCDPKAGATHLGCVIGVGVDQATRAFGASVGARVWEGGAVSTTGNFGVQPRGNFGIRYLLPPGAR